VKALGASFLQVIPTVPFSKIMSRHIASLFLIITIGMAEFPSKAIVNSPSALSKSHGYFPSSQKNIPVQLDRRLSQVDSISNTSIGGIKIGMSLQQVRNRLGKPRRLSQAYEPCTGGSLKTLAYDRLSIAGTSSVLTVFTSNPSYKTDRGVRVGDSIAKAKKIYGKVLLSSSSQEPGILNYMEEGGLLSLSFSYKNGKITSIRIHMDDC
jgi:hypothetical protein